MRKKIMTAMCGFAIATLLGGCAAQRQSLSDFISSDAGKIVTNTAAGMAAGFACAKIPEHDHPAAALALTQVNALLTKHDLTGAEALLADQAKLGNDMLFQQFWGAVNAYLTAQGFTTSEAWNGEYAQLLGAFVNGCASGIGVTLTPAA